MDCHTACMQQHSKKTWGKVSKMRLSSPSLTIVVTPRQPSVNAVGLFSLRSNGIIFDFPFHSDFFWPWWKTPWGQGKMWRRMHRCLGCERRKVYKMYLFWRWSVLVNLQLSEDGLLSAHVKILCILCVASCRLYNPEKKIYLHYQGSEIKV